MARVSLKNSCSICGLRKHIHWTRSDLQIKCFFLLAACHSFFFFFKFCNLQNQRESHSTKHRWNQSSKLLPFRSLLTLSFLAGTGKTLQMPPRKRTEFSLQLMFIRNTINNTWHFNKNLSEWFKEKQIHYVRSQ